MEKDFKVSLEMKKESLGLDEETTQAIQDQIKIEREELLNRTNLKI